MTWPFDNDEIEGEACSGGYSEKIAEQVVAAGVCRVAGKYYNGGAGKRYCHAYIFEQ